MRRYHVAESRGAAVAAEVADDISDRRGGWSFEPGGRGRAELWALLELLALCGFVVAQPLLDVVGQSPDFFIFHGVTPGEIMLLVAFFTLVPPLALWGIGALTGLAGAPARRAVHLGTVAVLFVLFMIQLGKYLTDLRGTFLAVLAVLAGAVVMAGYLRFESVRQLLRFAAVGPLVFVLLFAFASPSAAVVFPDDSPGAGAAPRVIGPNPPIVMIVLDELPLTSLLAADGTIDAERFPHFARLAGDSTWYRNATTVAGWTPYALPAMLTGTFPADHVAPHYSQYPDNLFTLLGGVYRIEANESIAQLCPPWQCGDLAGQASGGLPMALADTSQLLGEILSPADPTRDLHDDFAEPTVAERLGDAAAAGRHGPEFRFHQVGANQPARFHDFLQRLQDADGSDEPRMDFLHLLLPHTPWLYLPSGMRYETVPGLPVDGPWWGRLALQRMELQLQYTDRLLGEILHTLEITGRYDDALVVLTADHGVALTPGAGREGWIAGNRHLGPGNHGAEELAWVPMFIKEPGQDTPVVDDRNWQHVDLLPTIADLAGVEMPWAGDGISWVRQERTSGEKIYYGALDDIRTLDGDRLFAQILADPSAFPALPPAPLPELIGTAVAAYPVADGPLGTEVGNAEAFDDVALAQGLVPALVHGTVPDEVPVDTALAIAVNGRIGAVVPVVAGAGDSRRFAGLIADERLFRPGVNQLELFVIVDDGDALQHLPIFG
jgi:hypothetical protein